MTPDYLFRFRYLATAPDARGAQPVARTVEPVVGDAVCADAVQRPGDVGGRAA